MEYCREIEGAVIDDVIINFEVWLLSSHFKIIIKEILVNRHLANDWSKELESGELNPFRLIFGQFIEKLYDRVKFDLFTRYFRELRQNLYASFSNTPYGISGESFVYRDDNAIKDLIPNDS